MGGCVDVGHHGSRVGKLEVGGMTLLGVSQYYMYLSRS